MSLCFNKTSPDDGERYLSESLGQHKRSLKSPYPKFQDVTSKESTIPSVKLRFSIESQTMRT